MSSITTFMSSFAKSAEVARPSRFEVEFVVPQNIAEKAGNLGGITINDRLRLRCETAELPGKSFMTHDLKIYGPTEKFPYQHQYNDINLTFIVSGDMAEKKVFDAWMDYIAPTFKGGSYDFKYKNTYETDIKIRQLGLTNDIKYTAVLKDAYPIAVNQLDLDWSSDGHHKLNVTFAYTYWTNTEY